MSWIKTISYQHSAGKLRGLYERLQGPGGAIDSILRAHSLRPHTLEGHMALYKRVLHHSGNRLPKWLLETLGVYASMLNRCDYCVEHHWEGLRRLLRDDQRAGAIRAALQRGAPEAVFEGQELAALRYAWELTQNPAGVHEGLIAMLREAGFDDGEILEVNQVVSYFAYANRTVLGLGVTTKGDVLGLSPGDSNDPDNWHHG